MHVWCLMTTPTHMYRAIVKTARISVSESTIEQPATCPSVHHMRTSSSGLTFYCVVLIWQCFNIVQAAAVYCRSASLRIACARVL
jgi:hypothetical protein